MKKNDYKKSELVTMKYLDYRFKKFEMRFERRMDKKLVELRDGIIFYVDERLKPIEQKLSDFDDFKNQVLSRLDWLIGMYKKFEDEHTILTGRYSDVQVRLDSHDKRIGILEQKSS